MKLVLCALALCVGGIANAGELSLSQTHGWYCVSESPGGMQSSGHIGYGHGRTRTESARKAVESCRLDGGFSACGAAQCFRE